MTNWTDKDISSIFKADSHLFPHYIFFRQAMDAGNTTLATFELRNLNVQITAQLNNLSQNFAKLSEKHQKWNMLESELTEARKSLFSPKPNEKGIIESKETMLKHITKLEAEQPNFNDLNQEARVYEKEHTRLDTIAIALNQLDAELMRAKAKRR